MAATASEVRREIVLLEPAIALEFLKSIQQVIDESSVSRIEQLIAQGRIEQIATVLGVNAAALTVMLESVRTAYVGGGKFESGKVPKLRRADGGTFRIRFDIRNVRAETWLREHSSSLVTAIVEDQREAIRLTVTEGTRIGRNPRATALDIIGRVSRETGRRTGGIVGLTSQQARFVAKAREQLLSGIPEQMREYFTRQRRDRRFDGIVNRAIAEGRQVAPADVEKIVGRYADRLLLLRGETIARTEAIAAFNAARDETYRQAIDLGVKPENITKTWRTAGDGRVRDAHRSIGGQRRTFGDPYRSPTGALLMHPGDTSLGAGAEDVINCRCISSVRIDQLAEALRG